MHGMESCFIPYLIYIGQEKINAVLLWCTRKIRGGKSMLQPHSQCFIVLKLFIYLKKRYLQQQKIVQNFKGVPKNIWFKIMNEVNTFSS